MKRLLSMMFTAVLFITMLPTVSFADNSQEIYINGTEAVLNHKPYLDGDAWMVPFKEVMEKLGVPVEYSESTGIYSATVNDIDISVTAGTYTAEYDKITFELEHLCKDVQDDVMVEADFLDKIYDCDVKAGTAEIRINCKLQQSDDFDVDAFLAEQPNQKVIVSEDALLSSAISNPALLTKKIIDITDLPGYTKGVEIENLTEPASYWTSQITMPAENDIKENDILVITFWARKIKTVDESGMVTFNSTFEKMGGNPKYHNLTDYAGDEWTKFRYYFQVTDDLAASDAQLGMRVGYRYQTLQFAGLSIVNYGPDLDVSMLGEGLLNEPVYYGMEDDALWREEALKRIEKNRVRDIKIKLTDTDGNPVENANVKADMVKSEFLWGTAVAYKPMFVNQDTSEKYTRITLDGFNSLVMETGMKTGTFNMQQCVDMVNFTDNNDMYFRAHAILWDNKNYFAGVDADALTEQEAFDYLCRHASRILYNVGTGVDEIDVVNEALNNDFFRKKFGDRFVVDVIKAVTDMIDDVNPDIDVFVNETGIYGAESCWASVQRFREMVDEWISMGIKVDGLGVQNHTTVAVYPQEFYNQMDYLSEHVDKIAVTEYDYVSGFADDMVADELEAKYLRDMLIASYSHPKMTGFTMWGFTDDGHWKSNAPLYRADYSSKAALEYWNEYVNDKWFTHAAGTTGKDGTLTLRGHRGEYVITVEKDGQTSQTTLRVTADGDNTVQGMIDGASLSLIPSDPVVKEKNTDRILKTAVEQEEAEQAYLNLYKNRIKTVSRANGKNVDFLLQPTGNSMCNINKGEYITAELDSVMSKGYIQMNIQQNGDMPYICQIEGRNAEGEWFALGRTDSLDGHTISFDRDIDAIRISGVGRGQVQISGISVSGKEKIR